MRLGEGVGAVGACKQPGRVTKGAAMIGGKTCVFGCDQARTPRARGRLKSRDSAFSMQTGVIARDFTLEL